MSAATRWAIAFMLAIAAGLSWQLDGPSETQAAQDVADDADYAAVQADGRPVHPAATHRPLAMAQGDQP